MFKLSYYYVFLLSLTIAKLILSQMPQPIMTLHEGHVGLNDRLLETEFRGNFKICFYFIKKYSFRSICAWTTIYIRYLYGKYRRI